MPQAVVRVVLGGGGFVLPFVYRSAVTVPPAAVWDTACNAARLFSLGQGVWYATAHRTVEGMPYSLRWEAGIEVPT